MKLSRFLEDLGRFFFSFLLLRLSYLANRLERFTNM
jgi:hypothetical protein